MQWMNIETLADMEEAVRLSSDSPVIIFKHSTRCPTSMMAKRKLESDWSREYGNIRTYFLDLIRYREISNEIALQLGVQHESPQMILLQNEKVVYHNSHHQIDISEAVSKLK